MSRLEAFVDARRPVEHEASHPRSLTASRFAKRLRALQAGSDRSVFQKTYGCGTVAAAFFTVSRDDWTCRRS